jgi:hypothetical protein
MDLEFARRIAAIMQGFDYMPQDREDVVTILTILEAAGDKAAPDVRRRLNTRDEASEANRRRAADARLLSRRNEARLTPGQAGAIDVYHARGKCGGPRRCPLCVLQAPALVFVTPFPGPGEDWLAYWRRFTRLSLKERDSLLALAQEPIGDQPRPGRAWVEAALQGELPPLAKPPTADMISMWRRIEAARDRELTRRAQEPRQSSRRAI